MMHTTADRRDQLAGFQINSEVHTQHGRTDAVLEMRDKIIIFEFKLDKNAEAAFDQIKKKIG